jgi:hypothetical protein
MLRHPALPYHISNIANITIIMKLRSLLALGLLCLGCTATTQARTIAWGSDPNDVMLNSNGAALTDAYSFELGTFGSFVPTAANVDDWASNWKVLDRAVAPGVNGWNSAFGWVSGTVSVEPDQTGSRADLTQHVFAVGEQAYMLAYNNLAFGAPNAELALITDDSSDGVVADNWTIPVSATHDPTFIEWTLASSSTVVFGGLKSVQGPGAYTAPSGGFALQTHTDPVPVPEPSSALLGAMALGLIQARRKRAKA